MMTLHCKFKGFAYHHSLNLSFIHLNKVQYSIPSIVRHMQGNIARRRTREFKLETKGSKETDHIPLIYEGWRS